MDRSAIVTRLPVEELHTSIGVAERKRDLQRSDIQSLLELGGVRFVVADIGCKLRWVNESECYDFWKIEARDHIGTPGNSNFLDDFPGSYFYFASEWADSTTPIVLLSKCH